MNTPHPPHAGIDPLAVLAQLGLRDVAGATPIATATDSAVWRVEAQGGPFALRVLRAGQARRLHTETAAQWAAQRVGVPVPAVVAEGEWAGRPAQVQTWLPGDMALDTLRAAPWRVGELGRLLGAMQARIHTAAPPADAGLPDDADLIAAAADDAIAARLRTVPLRPAALLHGDYHPLNVLVVCDPGLERPGHGRSGMAISGVVDWANAAAGDPRFDQARTLSMLLVAPVGDALRAALAPLRRALANSWRAGYVSAGGAFGADALFLAWAGAFMQRDLAGKASTADLVRLRRWTNRWKRRAGL